jgi:hypothetical protein
VRQRQAYAQRVLRQEWGAWVAENRALLLQLLALGLGLLVLNMAVAAWVPHANAFLQGLFSGFSLAVFASLAVAAFFITSGSLYRFVGGIAEGGTRDELKRAARAKEIHGFVANLELAGYDIDALVVADQGVLAVEAKWHRAWPDQNQLARDVAATQRATGHARSVLRSLGHARTPVTGVLVLRSPQPAPLDRPDVVGGVIILTGDGLRPWLQASRGQAVIAADEGRALAVELEHFARRHGPQHSTSVRGPRPPGKAQEASRPEGRKYAPSRLPRAPRRGYPSTNSP